MTPQTPPITTGVLIALVGAFSYGFNITFAKISSDMGVSGPAVVALRVLVILVLAGTFAVLKGGSLAVPKSDRRSVFELGLGSAGVALCYLSSVTFIPITVAAVIFYTFPILIVILSPFVEGRKLTPSLIGVVLLAFVGVTLVLGPAIGDMDPRGIVLAAGASVSAAWQFFAGTRCQNTSTLSKIVWSQIVVLPGALFVVALIGGFPEGGIMLAATVPIALTIGGFLLGFVSQIIALTRISAVVAGLTFCLEPVVAAITSAIVLDERLGVTQYTGGALVIGAIMLNVWLESRRRA